MACFTAINTIMYDTNFDAVGENEKEISPEDWDPSFYASLAASGGAVWEIKNKVKERFEYWSWYLEVAIPRAWNIELELNISES